MRQEGMYICQNCGETFNREDMVSWTEPHGEFLKGCPHCGMDDYAEAQPCKACGQYHDEDKLFHGYCVSCLDKKAKNYGLMREYLTDEGLLVDFMFAKFFGMEVDDDWQITDKFRQYIDELYNRQVANEILLANNIPDYNRTFQRLLVEYIHIDTIFSLDNFAAWLAHNDGKEGDK